MEAFNEYVYERGNRHGWHLEWWLHVGGCRTLLKVVRHTLTHEISAIGGPEDTLAIPQDVES
jgi:heterotetrameric sarcosine oxidase delta subunit